MDVPFWYTVRMLGRGAGRVFSLNIQSWAVECRKVFVILDSEDF